MGVTTTFWRQMFVLAVLALFGLDLEAQALRPIPPGRELDKRLVELGRSLFHDPRLSLHQDVSCASCHDLKLGGADGLPLSPGTGGAITPYNTPSVLNAALVLKYGWEGAASNLREATKRALESPRAMGMTEEKVWERLRHDTDLNRKFGPLTQELILKSLMEFMESIVPRSAPLDRFLEGDMNALNNLQKRGFQRFIELGCASCHQGVGVGGNMFVRFGVMIDPFRGQTETHKGRFNVTKAEADRHVFRVPSLRNIAQTAPYFHDGHAQDLASAVRIMGHVQLGKQLSDEDVSLLIAFLTSLTGEIPKESQP